MRSHPFSVKDRRFDPGKWILLGGTFLLSCVVFFQMVQNPSSDISIHTAWAGECDFADLTTFVRHGAHPMWHTLVTLVALLGVKLEWAAVLITALCKTAEVWLIHRLVASALEEKFSRGVITCFAGVCSLVSCLCVPFFNPTVYLGVGSPNTWHSCTQLCAMVWMLLCVPYTAYCYDSFTDCLPVQKEAARISWRSSAVLGCLLFLSLLAKPTFMQAFLPAACLYFLVQWIRHPRNSRYFLQIIACVLPSVLFMIFQYLYYFGIIVPWQASMQLQFSLQKCLDGLLRAVLMMAFPLYALFVTRRQKADTCYVLTLAFTAVAVLEYLILGENGRRAADGNFGWGMMGASLMLWVVCLIRFLKEAHDRPAALRLLPGWVLLGWHLVSGVYYLYYLLSSGAAL